MIDLNSFAHESLAIAKARGKYAPNPATPKLTQSYIEYLHLDGEVTEFLRASSSKPSHHCPILTEEVEELADVVITGLSCLARRGVNIEDVLITKQTFNSTRPDVHKPATDEQ